MSTVSHIGFLDRFRTTTAAAQLPPGRFAPLPEDGFVRVVGESYCQPALAALRDKFVPGIEGRPMQRLCPSPTIRMTATRSPSSAKPAGSDICHVIRLRPTGGACAPSKGPATRAGRAQRYSMAAVAIPRIMVWCSRSHILRSASAISASYAQAFCAGDISRSMRPRSRRCAAVATTLPPSSCFWSWWTRRKQRRVRRTAASRRGTTNSSPSSTASARIRPLRAQSSSATSAHPMRRARVQQSCMNDSTRHAGLPSASTR
jgi:hypothetical protein